MLLTCKDFIFYAEIFFLLQEMVGDWRPLPPPHPRFLYGPGIRVSLFTHSILMQNYTCIYDMHV